MLRIPFNAYDNWAATVMKICLSLGVTLAGSGLLSLMPIMVFIGLAFIVLFFVFKIINKRIAQNETNKIIDLQKQEVNSVLNNRMLSTEEKINEIIFLARNGNKVATIVLQSIYK